MSNDIVYIRDFTKASRQKPQSQIVAFTHPEIVCLLDVYGRVSSSCFYKDYGITTNTGDTATFKLFSDSTQISLVKFYSESDGVNSYAAYKGGVLICTDTSFDKVKDEFLDTARCVPQKQHALKKNSAHLKPVR